MVLRQVPSGLPRCLFPWGAQDSASSGCRPFFMQRTWPSYVHRLLFTSRTMLIIPVRLQISSLHTFSCHLRFNILPKHLPSKPRSLLSTLDWYTGYKCRPVGLCVFDDCLFACRACQQCGVNVPPNSRPRAGSHYRPISNRAGF